MKTNDRKRTLTTAAIATALPLQTAPVTPETVRGVLLDIDAGLLTDLHRATCALASVTVEGPLPPRTRAAVQEPLKQIVAILREARTQIADVESRL